MPHQREPFRYTQFRKPFVLWPIVVLGFVLGVLHWLMPTVVTDQAIGDIWLPALILVTFAAVEDFHFWQGMVVFIVVALVVAILTIVSMYFELSILRWAFSLLRIVRFSVTADAVVTISTLYAIGLSLYGIDILIRRRWIVAQGIMFRPVFGYRAEELIISPPYAVTYEIPDVMDGVIMSPLGFKGLAGDLIVTKDGKEIRRIHMVLGVKQLAFRIQPYQALATEEQDRSTASQPGQTVPH
ncbi:MAG: hypothetical protein KBC47_03735 [Candidatus Peribacteraceae bacterium]|nr:hypothetical protein [Candidatus Peribacteraceae bacterium]